MPSDAKFFVNGKAASVFAAGDATLLDVLRNTLGLKGTRFGCGEESCGACMVVIDGEAAFSCQRTLDRLAGVRIETVEGLGPHHPLTRAFLAEQAGQCGYCLSGILMSAKALLDRNPAPSRQNIVDALEPHLCRCGSHLRIIKAVERAAELARA